MANHHRGEIEAVLGGQRRTLCLTLGALAELESSFAAHNMSELAHRFASGNLSARDLLVIIACGLRGAGCDISDQEVAAMRVDGGLAGYFDIVSRLLFATFGEAEAAPQNPPRPQDTPGRE